MIRHEQTLYHLCIYFKTDLMTSVQYMPSISFSWLSCNVSLQVVIVDFNIPPDFLS